MNFKFEFDQNVLPGESSFPDSSHPNLIVQLRRADEDVARYVITTHPQVRQYKETETFACVNVLFRCRFIKDAEKMIEGLKKI